MADYDGKSGIISKIHLENFMCHSNLDIEFGDYVNFITGQNGSGKSAILTALCVAFGTRARGTQRANTLKDFIRNGCSYALVRVELKNQGQDAFKPDVYGNVIVVERRISESTSSIALKNRQGRKMGTKRDDLREVMEHFNIDVENPCVIMSQDKSREFLHSGNAKDKFKFFYKATLLQKVDDLLNGIEKHLSDATAQLCLLEQSLRPVLKELDQLKGKIKGLKSLENDSIKLQLLRKKLAWALVYNAEKKLGDLSKEIEKLQAMKFSLQREIDQQENKIKELTGQLATKRSEIDKIIESTSNVGERTAELQQSCYTAMKKEAEIQCEKERITKRIQYIDEQIVSLGNKIRDLHEQHVKDTEAAKNKIQENLTELETLEGKVKDNCQRLQASEDETTKEMTLIKEDIKDVTKKIEEARKGTKERSTRMLNLHNPFGGHHVTNLWRLIDENQSDFTCPPIGPIGAHLKLTNGEKWAVAVETAVGILLDAFIVTNHKDQYILRRYAMRAGHWKLRIIVYDFSIARLEIPWYMLPCINHPTVLSELHTDNHVVRNVLIDEGSAERQVLVENYDVGKTIAFDSNIQNLKEVFTTSGQKLFQRRLGQSILPPDRRFRTDRLCDSFDDKIKAYQHEIDVLNASIQENQRVVRTKENDLKDLEGLFEKIKISKKSEERKLRVLRFELKDLKSSLSEEADTDPTFNVDVLNKQISNFCEERVGKQILLEKLQIGLGEAGLEVANCNAELENFVDSTKAIRVALSKAEKELVKLEKDVLEANTSKEHYEVTMRDEVLTKLENAETEYVELGNQIKEDRHKVSITCPKSDVEDLNCEETSPEHLSAQITRLEEKLECESESESIEDVRIIYEKKQRETSRKRRTYKALREKLEACEEALRLRYINFKRNEKTWIRELRQEFNGHLVKKGIQGKIRVDVEEKALLIEVTMPQDSSNTAVRDTRGLSGGERSFSTVCFALTIHGMTEAPFRAMDEFDVFMDAVSRKISLDAVVDFALEKGSQWIFITPHDISMVRDHERIKKQQMAAPRG